MNTHRKTLSGATLVVLAVLFVAAMLVINPLLRGARADLTGNKLYTLSEGTRNILGSIKEPINLYLFFSDKASADIPQLRTYYQRVREMLEEMAARSGGKLKLEVIDPLPFSEEEDRASAFGLQAVPADAAGNQIYFGLAGTNATDGEQVIPFLQPDKEALLEYDVAKLVHTLSNPKKPVIGLLSGLDIGVGFDPQTQQMRQGWAIDMQWRQLFDVRPVDPSALAKVDDDIDVLVLVQPKQLSEDAQYAIDQFVLRGGRLLAFVDPSAEMDRPPMDPNNPQAAQMAMLADKSSDLPRLFKGWGVQYDPGKVVLDRGRAQMIGMMPGAPPVRHPAVLGLTREDIAENDVITANLDTINVFSAGSLALAGQDGAKDAAADGGDKAAQAGSAGLTLTPLLQTSDEATLVDGERLRMLFDPRELYSDYPEQGRRYVIAARLSGKFKSAFPDRKEAGHLAESKDAGQVVLVADTDLLSDMTWVQMQNFFGQRVMTPFAGNGDFAVNAVDNLGGSSDLISVRGRAVSQRPFTRVEELRRHADESFRNKEKELQQELAETERKLTELQSAKGSQESAMLLSDEQKAELDQFVERKLEIRKELRQVRRQLDAEIEALGTRLKFVNIVLVPLLITAVALAFAWRRRRRRDEAAKGRSGGGSAAAAAAGPKTGAAGA